MEYSRKLFAFSVVTFMILIGMSYNLDHVSPYPQQVIYPVASPTASSVAMSQKHNRQKVDSSSQPEVDSSRQPEVDSSRHPELYLLMNTTKGQLGNTMFQYASLRGIAEKNGRIPVMLGWEPHAEQFSKIFQLKPGTLTQNRSLEWKKFKWMKEKWCCIYDERMDSLPETDMRIGFFFQSFRYFEVISDEIRREFQFRDEIEEAALNFMASIPTDTSPANTDDVTTTYIGVHVRNDMSYILGTSNDSTGRMSTPVEYFGRAMKYFQGRFAKVKFVLSCKTPQFCHEFIAANRSDCVVAEGNDPEVDMAILSKCNHTIISAGTFSWWSAWLAGGVTIYHAGFPAPGTNLASNFNREDYYPPSWIGIW